MKKIGLLVILCISSFTLFGQKKVLFEKYTNAFCGVCPDATILIDEIVRNNPDVIWISHHKPIGFMEHPLNNDASDAIWDELGINGVPTGLVDRKVYDGNITLSRTHWEEKIQEQLEKPDLFQIEVSQIQYDASLRALSFDVGINPLVADLTGPFRVTAYIIEDSIIRAQSSYFNDTAGHPLEGRGDLINDYEHRNVVRTILEDHWGTSNVVPDQPELGTMYTHSYSYTMDQEINPENVHIVSMISSFDEANHYPGEVHTASRIKLNELGIKLTHTFDLEKLEISLSPNPSKDFINLQFENIPDQISICSLEGVFIKTMRPSAKNVQLDVSAFKPGVYLLSAKEKDKLGIQKFNVVRQ